MTDAEKDARRIELEQLRWLEIASILEATTLVLLVSVAVPLKHFAGLASAVQVMGPIHGVVFLAYLWVALQTVSAGGWRTLEMTRLFVSAFVPFGGFVNLPWLARKMAKLR